MNDYMYFLEQKDRENLFPYDPDKAEEQERISRLLHHFLTEYDRKQSKKKSYNPRALGIYFEAAERCMEEIKKGENVQKNA